MSIQPNPTTATARATTLLATPPEFQQELAREFKPKSEQHRTAVQTAVQTLALHALTCSDLISDDATKTIQCLIAELDRKLSEQANLILHHPDFQQLEGTWRGLHHLASRTETDEQLQIRVFNISKKDLLGTFRKYSGTSWDRSPLFRKIYEEEFGTPGGKPFGCLLGDYYFDHSAPDVEVLKGMAQIAAAAHAPFIAAASPSLMNLESWQELSDPSDISKIFTTADYASWRGLRDLEDARYVGLTMPRFLGRLPYGARTNPVDDFAFEEQTEGASHDRFVWCNAAYAMGTNIARAFKIHAWCSAIRGAESGGAVEGLPCHTFPTDDGGVDMKCPTEIAITDRREAELATCGLMPLVHWKNSDAGIFIGAQSLQNPPRFEDPDATSNARLGARLPYLFATCRFAHYLKCMVRDKIGSFRERAEMEIWLNNWVAQYVVLDANASDETKARYPLAAAEVQVEEVPGNPGYYLSRFFLRPHFQLEGLTVSLRLVSRLPSIKHAA